MSAKLEVICGPMFSGKSEELIRRLNRLNIAKRPFLAIKPANDLRYGADDIRAHGGAQIPCKLMQPDVSNFWQVVEQYDTIAIDEVQFFDPILLERLDSFLSDPDIPGHVIVSGLDMTYRREPFGIVPHLMAIADEVTKLNAVCHSCGSEAIYTQRLIDGKPAPFSGETIQVGGLDSYEARCRRCFQEG